MRGFRRRGIQDRLRRNGGVPTESPTLTLEQLSPSFLSKSGSDYSSGNGGANAGGKKKTKEWADSPASEQEYGNDTHIPWADDENHAQDDGDEFGDDDASHSYYSERFLRSGGNTDTGPSSTSALRDIGNREMYSPPLSQELDEWLAASALRRRKLRTSSMASSLWVRTHRALTSRTHPTFRLTRFSVCACIIILRLVCCTFVSTFCQRGHGTNKITKNHRAG